MSAREGFLGSWVLAVLLISLSPSTSAQCERDVFLALGGLPSSPSTLALAPPAQVSPKLSNSAATEIGSSEAVQLTEAQILALPVSVIVTATDWTPVSRFEGPLLSDVLKLKASPAQTLRVTSETDRVLRLRFC